MPPKIERKHLKDITVSAGEMLKFEGNIIGEPPADVTWKKETDVIETTRDKSVVITNVPYNTKLIIRSCQRTDQVSYIQNVTLTLVVISLFKIFSYTIVRCKEKNQIYL